MFPVDTAMAAFVFTCMHCGHAMRTSVGLPPGKVLKCNLCGKTFAAAARPSVSHTVPSRAAAMGAPAWTVPTHVLGPDAEEFADFDRASRPRSVAPSVGGVLAVVAGLMMLLLVVSGGITAVELYNANQPQSLIIGSWQSVDHPDISSLVFATGGGVKVVAKNGNASTWSYRFITRHTVEISPPFVFDDQGLIRFRLSFEGNRMTTLDEHKKATHHWLRRN
jgi:hypothetical protein